MPTVTTTTKHLKHKSFSWSFSRLKAYEDCPRQFREVMVDKKWPEEKSEQLKWGDAVHAAMAHALTSGTPLSPPFDEFQPWIDKTARTKGDLLVETQWAITKEFKAVPWFASNVWLRVIGDAVKLDKDRERALVIDWKGLSVDTPIPTANGFLRIGDLQVGDHVFGSDGMAYPVIGKSEIKQLPCYRVEFTSGFGIVCDHEHLWLLADGAVVPVTALQPGFKIALPAPVNYPERSLPIDPYVFGIWLADGKHTSGEVSKPDADIWIEIQRRGYDIGDDISSVGKCRTHTIRGIRGLLTALGVLGNKHIPDTYLYGSVQQRRDLLAGLLDGDGHANAIRKQVVVDMTNQALLFQVAELARSLGERVLTTTFSKSGFDKTVIVWRAAWRPRANPFLLPRKRNTAALFEVGREYLEIADIVPLPTEPTQCIAVDSPDHTYLCGREYVVTHNTGKSTNADILQLTLTSLMLFAQHPWLQQVQAAFIWLPETARTDQVIERHEAADQWAEIMPRVKRFEQAVIDNEFPPKPGNFCRNWCPVRSCEYNGK